LRYWAFKHFDYEKNYQGALSDFVERDLKKINLMDECTRAQNKLLDIN
jgi:hypothetical protein